MCSRILSRPRQPSRDARERYCETDVTNKSTGRPRRADSAFGRRADNRFTTNGSFLFSTPDFSSARPRPVRSATPTRGPDRVRRPRTAGAGAVGLAGRERNEWVLKPRGTANEPIVLKTARARLRGRGEASCRAR